MEPSWKIYNHVSLQAATHRVGYAIVYLLRSIGLRRIDKPVAIYRL